MSKKYDKLNITVPFTTIGTDTRYLPLKLSEDASIFALLCQKKLLLNPGVYTPVPTGIRIMTPSIVETTKDGNTTSKYSKLVLQVNLHSSPYLVESKGVILVAPTVLSPTHHSQILLFVKNISRNIQTIHQGEELALLTFTMVPRITLDYIENDHPTDLKGNPYVL
nr:MAG TPA: deoxyuridine 5'-triphosphate nucleotidohydrolase [Bacteriophage sp.]